MEGEGGKTKPKQASKSNMTLSFWKIQYCRGNFFKTKQKFLKKFARRGIHNIASLKKPGVLNYGTIK